MQIFVTTHRPEVTWIRHETMIMPLNHDIREKWLTGY